MVLRTPRIIVACTALALSGALHAQEAVPAAPSASMILGAAAKPDKDYKPALGLDNWTYEYDVSGFKPGVYNIIARAIDSAGNVSFATPFNMIVDPASDLPIARIVSPLPLARVGADLNIVGACVDDDSVAYVEVSLDGGAWAKAQGADYWSSYLATSAMEDGIHVISVRGVDVNGLSGLESRVSFHLDRTKPLHAVRSPSFGSLASGRIAVSGSVFDANGLQSVAYSTDSGLKWSPLAHAYDKATKTASFSLAVDTKKMPDGPAVLWLKSVDRVGSEGIAVFLYFVDNTKPELAVLSPAEGESVNGAFAVTGRIYDTVGVSSLAWTYEKEAGTIELFPGNPYFSLPLLAPSAAGQATVRFVATDAAGNVSTVAVTRAVDPKADLPTVALSYPLAGAVIEGSAAVAGGARDDDGVASILWRVDGGPETTVAATGAFSFPIYGLASGQRVLSVRAIDVNGLSGPTLSTPFTYSGAAPRISLSKAADASGERDFRPGVSLSTLDGKAALSGSIVAANPLVELSYAVNGGPAVKISFVKTAEGASFVVPLSASLPYGVLDVTIRAIDSLGKSGTAREPVLAIDYSKPRAGPLLDFGFQAEPTAEAPRTVRLSDAAPLSISFVTPFPGEGIKTVLLEPATKLVKASFEGGTVRLVRVADGISLPTIVAIETERGHRFVSGPFVFKSDSTPPVASIREPAFGSWRTGAVPLVVEASDSDDVSSVEYSANGGEWKSMGRQGSAYSAAFDASALSGPVLIEIRAIDATGNASRLATAFMADATPPAPKRLLPKDGDSVSGPTLFVFQTGEGAQSLHSVELLRGGSTEALEQAAVVSFTANPSDGPLSLKVADKAGNAALLDPMAGLTIAAASAPQPLDTIKSNAASVPATIDGQVARISGTDAVGALSWTAPFAASPDAALFPAWAGSPIRVSGTATLSAAFSGISPDPKKPVASWGFSPDAIDQPLAIKLDKSGSWTAAIKAPARPDGRATLWISVQEASGTAVFTSMALDYDSTPAAIEFASPLPIIAGAKPTATGPFTLAIRSTDARGIASSSYEYGAEKGELALLPGSGDAIKTFSFVPKSGVATITVRTVDGSGNPSSSTIAVSYDAASDAPAIRFLAPLDGATRNAQGPVVLYALDDDEIASVSLSIDGAPFSAQGQGPLYSLDAGPASYGKHTLQASATDINGLPSAKASLAFTHILGSPSAVIASIEKGAASGAPALEPFIAGSTLVVDGKTAFMASVEAPNGLAKLEYSINGGAWTSSSLPKPGADGRYSARIPLPSSLPYERSVVALKATDATGAVAEASTSFYRVAPARELASVGAEGVYAYDSRIADDGSVALAQGEELRALWYGRPIESTRLEPSLAFAEASFDGAGITVKATADGGAGNGALPVAIVVRTVDGELFRSKPLRIIVDSSAPELSIHEPDGGSPVRGPFRVSGTAADPNGIASVAWSIDGGASWTPFELPNATAAPGSDSAPAGPSIAYSGVIKAALPEGQVGVLVKATDRSGAYRVATSSVWNDESAPLIAFESPRAIDTVNGTILISGYADDEAALAGMSFSPDGETWEPIASSPRGAAVAALPAKDAERAPIPAPSRRIAFSRIVDLGALPAGGTAMAFKAIDASGNQAIARPLDQEKPAFAVDIAADKPVIQIQIPADAEVERSDFIVSGMAFDDDGVAELFWRLDGSEWGRLDGGNGFAVPLKLLSLSDNEHVFEAYAVDLNGVKGEQASRTFRVSREEPVGQLTAPGVSFTNRGVITLSGTASDANGIAAVSVSFDNGATYNDATGTTSWSYVLDTRTVPDGVHSIYIKLADGYGTPGFAAGLISVDNTPPELTLDTPHDGSEGVGSITVGGRVSDGIAVRSLSLEISRIGSSEPLLVIPMPTTGVFSRPIDIQSLAPGWYDIKAVALDTANNAAYAAVNVVVLEARKADTAELLFPAHGERVSGTFTIDGRITVAEPIAKAAITLDGKPFAVVAIAASGWFSFPVDPASLEDGVRTFRVETVSSAGTAIVSDPRSISYTREGPWIDISAVASGDFIVGRPYLSGKAGWDTPEPNRADKAAVAAYRKLVEERRVVRVELSRDNGKTYSDASGNESWKYRLETQEYPNGALRLVMRATFAGGQTAVRKRMVVLDTKPPAISLIKPAEKGRYNGIVSIEGTASDDNGLSSVSVMVRSGDKASYEVPGFIQGSYADVHLMGATRMEAGIGLSFFEDNVKLQAEIGKGFDAQPTWDNLFGYASADTPAGELSRFGGYVLGARLLANLAYLPFSYFFGPDWDFFSMSFALGASFTYFSQQDAISDILSPPEGKYMVLSGVVGQWEFAKFDFGWSFFKTVGLYVEGGLVFIPSEVSTKLEEFIRPNIAFGLRVGLF